MNGRLYNSPNRPLTMERPATTKQETFIEDLLSQVELTDDQSREAWARLERGLTATTASRWIDRLLELRKQAKSQAPERVRPQMPDVPAGRYAVEGDDGELRFYRVDRPTEGRWAGYTFVRVQASDDLHRLPSRATEAGVLRKIAEDVRGAAIRYGREIGCCSRCGRTLTNNISRELGIGPVCGGRVFGDEFGAEVRSARASLRRRGIDPDAAYVEGGGETESERDAEENPRVDGDGFRTDADEDGRVHCLDEHAEDGGCEGAVEYRMPLTESGRSFPRCEKHWAARVDFQRYIGERYPQSAPADFDPAYAGERWEEDA